MKSMKNIAIAFLVMFGISSTCFSAELPAPHEYVMYPMTLTAGGSLNSKWISECQARVADWTAVAQTKLVAFGGVGVLQAKPEFDVDTRYDRDQDSSCYSTTTTLECQVDASLEDPRFRLARLGRTIKLRGKNQGHQCKSLRAEVMALPETLTATYGIRSAGLFGSECLITSLAVTNR